MSGIELTQIILIVGGNLFECTRVIKMLNFNQSDPNIGNQNFSCQMDQNGPSESQTGSSVTVGSGGIGPSAYSTPDQQQQQPSYPLMANFNNLSGVRGRMTSPGLHPERFFDHTNSLHDSVHQTADTIFPFVMPSKGSENVKRFSVNNLLQLAQCTTAGNLLSSARSLGK